MSLARLIVTLTAVALLAGACGAPQPDPGTEPASPPATPEEAALAPFALVDTGLPPDADVEALALVFDRERFADDPTELLDALSRLRGVRHLRRVASERLPGLDRWVVDLEGEVDGPALAEFSVHVEPRGDEGWRVVWFHGPDCSWPVDPLP